MVVVDALCRARWDHQWALLGISLTILCLVACSRSEFERRHEHAVLENPAGVELEIRTRDGKKHFAASEPVQFEELYTSKYSGLWHMEVLDYWNQAGVISEVVHFTDGAKTWDQPEAPHTGYICCGSRHVWLSLDPVRVPYKLFTGATRSDAEAYTNPAWHTIQLPSTPGKYQVYITTVRVFGRDYSTTTYSGKGVPLSSNILKLEVK
jgi:hypothetical protein